jgi:hypothetical protein
MAQRGSLARRRTWTATGPRLRLHLDERTGAIPTLVDGNLAPPTSGSEFERVVVSAMKLRWGTQDASISTAKIARGAGTAPSARSRVRSRSTSSTKKLGRQSGSSRAIHAEPSFMDRPQLYGTPLSHFTRKIRILLDVFGVEFCPLVA